MPQYKYVIVGGGMTADSAVRGIREIDDKGSIALFSLETDPPYDRPPLSKGVWKGRPLEDVWRNTKDLGVDLFLGRRVTSLDPQNKSLADDQGGIYTFDKLLLATGGTSRRLPFGGEHVIYFRTMADYLRLRDLTNERERFAVIGGGFIGSEIAAALSMTDKKVTMLLHGDIGARTYPSDLARFVTDFYREKGVDVRTGEDVIGLEERGAQTIIMLRNVQSQKQSELAVDAVVAGLGIEPNVDLAQAAGLTTGDGIEVDRYLRTNHPDIFAAGDVASVYNPALDRRMRVEHEDNANTMGQAAGYAMAGELAEYNHLPFFYSDLFELGYEAVGDLDSRLETISDWKEPFREGVVYYMKDRRVRGVLLWNVWEQVDAARQLIAEPGPFEPRDLKGRLPVSK